MTACRLALLSSCGCCLLSLAGAFLVVALALGLLSVYSLVVMLQTVDQMI
jgi:hypothetical protein